MSIGPLLQPLARILHIGLRQQGNWCFLVEPHKPWGGNLRAVCEAAAADERIKHILILNAGTTDNSDILKSLSGSQCKIEIRRQRPGLSSYPGIFRATHVFHEEYKHFGLPNCLVNLWHGIPIKKIGVFHSRSKIKKGKQVSKSFSARDLSRHDFLLASSTHDQVVMSACFQMPPEKVLPIGLPRNDWLDPELSLPPDLQKDFERLESLKAGRKLVLYAPTFRDNHKDVIPLNPSEIEALARQLAQQKAILGLRLHPTSEGKIPQLTPELGYLDCSSLQFPEVQVLLRGTDVLLTDYSSTCLDFCLTNRPSVSYCPDLDDYSRGFLYPLDTVFPGPLVKTADELSSTLERCLKDPASCAESVTRSRTLFHEQANRNISRTLINRLLGSS